MYFKKIKINQNMLSRNDLEVSAAGQGEVGSHEDRNTAWLQCQMRK